MVKRPNIFVLERVRGDDCCTVTWWATPDGVYVEAYRSAFERKLRFVGVLELRSEYRAHPNGMARRWDQGIINYKLINVSKYDVNVVFTL